MNTAESNETFTPAKTKRHALIGVTGLKQNYYTLYTEMETKGTGVYICSMSFVKNLTTDEQKLPDIIEMLQECGRYDTVEVCGKTRKLQKHNLEAFNLIWKVNKKGTCFYSSPSGEFWESWKKDKALIKSLGFWLNKSKEGQWMIFRKLEDYSEQDEFIE